MAQPVPTLLLGKCKGKMQKRKKVKDLNQTQ
jgi:hypothetical protein